MTQTPSSGSSNKEHKFAAYIGLTLEDARAMARSEGRRSRVKWLEGRPQAVSQDAIRYRLNFAVQGGIVTDVKEG